MAAAPRKTAAPESPVPYNMGLGSEDVSLPRLRIVGKLAKMIDLGVAKSGDIAIGQGAEDDESMVVPKGESVRFYVLSITPNYACSYADVERDPALKGQWEQGDPDMPPQAKRQFNYLLFVPEFDSTFPVKYTASSTAAREARAINTKLTAYCLGGGAPYELCFEMSTKMNTAGQHSWPGPVFKLVESNDGEVQAAKAMHDSVVGPPRTQLEETTPSF